MKKLPVLLAITGLLAFLSGPVAAFEDEVTVHFRSAVTPQYIQLLNQTFRTQAVKLDGQTWRFKVPALKTQDQYAELFSSLATVADTDPVPMYQVSDHINPQAVNLYPVPNQEYVKSQDYLPGELLVKFKPGTTPDDIRFLNSHNDVSEISRIAGIDVYRLRLPENLSVAEAAALYNQSGIVQYAEPNYRFQLQTPAASPQGAASPQAGAPGPQPGAPSPQPSATPAGGLPQGTAVYTQIPLDGGGQMLVSFRPGTSQETVAQFHQLFGTRLVHQESFYQYRIQLPPGANPGRALRVFMLFPAVSDVQRLYS